MGIMSVPPSRVVMRDTLQAASTCAHTVGACGECSEEEEERLQRQAWGQS